MKKLLFSVLVACSMFAEARSIKLSNEAIDIEVGAGTTFWMYYPEVKVNGSQQRPSKV